MALLCGCRLGPDYQKPQEPTTTAWQWTPAEPKDEFPKGPWWELYEDPKLNELEEQAILANPNLRSVVASVDGARAQVIFARGAFFPDLSATGSAVRESTSGNQPLPISGITGITPSSITTPLYTATANVSFEIDLWGAIRRGLESAQANLESNIALYQNALLTLQAEVASQYFLLRVADAETRLLKEAVKLLTDNLNLVRTQYRAGLTDDLAVAQAESLQCSTIAQLDDKQRQRETFQNALAVLCGQPACNFSISPAYIVSTPFEVPPGLPSTLLERRPDVAASERALASTCAQIGIAYANFFPNVSLTGQFGYLSTQTQNFISSSSQLWSFGPAVTLPIFQGGQLVANLKSAKAVYEGSLASYQATVIQAFSDVQTALSDVHYYKDQWFSQNKAAVAAQRAATLSKLQYERGLVSYLQVVDADRTAINTNIAALDLVGARFLASVQLIKTLGGGWSVAELNNANAPTIVFRTNPATGP
ncbi:MAG TPA: efflux transporter outer membrane subunit [Opitutales bacterium]|nr:efflux transporter outer membrane subunit [Opitutales bacterium]